MSNGKWQMDKQRGFAILHLRFAIQEAFFSILPGLGRTTDSAAATVVCEAEAAQGRQAGAARLAVRCG